MFGVPLATITSTATTVSTCLASVLLLTSVALVAGRAVPAMRTAPGIQAVLAAVRAPLWATALALAVTPLAMAVPMCTTGQIESGGGICAPSLDPDFLLLSSVHPVFWGALCAFTVALGMARPYPQVMAPKK